MSDDSYYAREHYKGEEVVKEYDDRRKAKPKWAQEQAIVSRFIKGLPKGAKLLDCPVGTGRFLSYAAEAGLKATGVDISPGMVEESRKLSDELGGDFDFQVVDATNLPFETDSFDALVSHRFIKWLPDDEAILKVLTHFGRVCSGPMLIQVKHVQNGTLMTRLFGGRRKRADKGRKFTEAEIHDLFEKAGLTAERFDEFASGGSVEVYHLCKRKA